MMTFLPNPFLKGRIFSIKDQNINLTLDRPPHSDSLNSAIVMKPALGITRYSTSRITIVKCASTVQSENIKLTNIEIKKRHKRVENCRYFQTYKGLLLLAAVRMQVTWRINKKNVR